MRLKVLNIQDVAETRLCCGCGACAYVDPEHIAMVDVQDQGRRPHVTANGHSHNPDAMKACPGIELRHGPAPDGAIPELQAAWGPVLEVWEGFAVDPEIRFAGSSGGAASALSLFCIERGGMHGVLHTAAREDIPYLNKTTLSRNRTELLASSGSRYAPASPCDSLDKIETAPAPCVFIGKPCDVAATSKVRALRPALDAKLGLTIAVFCAGTPSTAGTLEMLRSMGVTDLANVRSVRYRGNGWPGHATVRYQTPTGEREEKLTYAESWGNILQRHRQWRCYVCVDHTGEFADVAVGDPWHRPIPPGEPGRSLVLVRTERGRKLVRDAVAAGYLQLEQVPPSTVEASQPGFPTVRGSVWGRIFTCRLFGVPTPRYYAMPMLRFWFTRLTLKEKMQSLLGTVKRIGRKGLRQRADCTPTPEPSTEPVAALMDSPRV